MSARALVTGDRVVAAVAAGLLLALVAGTAVWGWTRRTDPPPAPQRFTVRAELEPRSYLFGDRVTATLELEFDRRIVETRSVRVFARFAPYVVVVHEPSRRAAGNDVLLRHRFHLQCLAVRCTPQGGPVTLELSPFRIDYRLRTGVARSLAGEWAPSFVHSRLLGTPLQAGDPRIRPAWRLPAAPPAVSYRLEPGLMAGLLFAAAAAAALAGAALLWPQLRALGRRLWVRDDSLAGLPPLERALALLERALASGADDDQRKALDRLARELRARGEDDLARTARRLAWSAGRPADEAQALTGNVARALGSRA